MENRTFSSITSTASVNASLQDIITNKYRLTLYDNFLKDAVTTAQQKFIKKYSTTPDDLIETNKTLTKEIIKWAKADYKKSGEFWDGKTLTLSNGTISLAISPGKVGLIKKIAKNFDYAIALLKKSSPFKKYLRQPEVFIDKERLTADFTDGKLTNEKLAVVGLKIAKPVTCTVKLRDEG